MCTPRPYLVLQGPVDLKEERHAPQRVAAAAAAVAHMLKQRKGWSAEERERCPVVVLTGAGISTAAGIPDFRGPHGVWTAEACGRAAPGGTSLEFAQPTFSHMALVALQVPMMLKLRAVFDIVTPVQGQGVVDAVISQNIDGLHLRSGLPPGCLYELHGNSFMERCRRCHKTHFRPFDVKGMSFKPTGRCCEGLRSAAARQKRARDDDGSVAFEACGGELHDFMLDWGDALPAAQLKASERLCQRALCLLCLGTSLYINPCGLLPTRTKKSGGKVIIVSLSATAQDAIADVVSHAEADEFLAQLCTQLDVRVPRFVPALTFYVAQACTRAPNSAGHTVNWRVAVSACSDAQLSPLPHLLRATARVRSAVAVAGGSACSTSPPAAVCKLERCDLMPPREIFV